MTSQRKLAAEAVRRSRSAAITLVLIVAAALGSCDLEVINPGPVQDTILDDPQAHEAVIRGAERQLATIVVRYWGAGIGLSVAAVTRELTPAGNPGGMTMGSRRGLLLPDEQGPNWAEGQRARWMAEDAVRRFQESLGEAFESSPLAARAYLLAGYANRLLGENMCEAVIDGGPAQPHTAYLERAYSSFTKALEMGQSIGDSHVALAARAGRASVQVHQGEWAGAVADAQEVPRNFVFSLDLFASDNWVDNNGFWLAVSNNPFRTNTVWNTFFHDYYLETNDPRTSWESVPGFPLGDQAIQEYGNQLVPFLRQTKYGSLDAPVRFSSGREMVLIRAEERLRSGDLQGGLALINSLREDVGVAPWTATNLEEAWTALKDERFIELWLEARRLGDLRRWQAEGTPGAERTEDPEAVFALPQRDMCFPISQAERDTNPNLRG